ncbi:MAG: hypothetical protein U0Q11_16850 [Vicinamibacterales bacterium]
MVVRVDDARRAILTTVVTLIIQAGLGRKIAKLYDPEVTNGKILVGIESPRDASGRRRRTRAARRSWRAGQNHLVAATAAPHESSSVGDDFAVALLITVADLHLAVPQLVNACAVTT